MYWALLCTPVTRTSWVACRYRVAPETRASFGRSRVMIWSADTGRCSSGFSETNALPVLVVVPAPPPVKAITVATAGSDLMMSTNCVMALHGGSRPAVGRAGLACAAGTAAGGRPLRRRRWVRLGEVEELRAPAAPGRGRRARLGLGGGGEAARVVVRQAASHGSGE